MGKINQGVLGGFSGKVGTVVGASWKGVSYMRSVAQSVKNPQTDKQVAHRKKFGFLIQFLGQMEALLAMTFKTSAQRMSGVNAAMKANFANNAVTMVGNEPTLDFTKLTLGVGPLNMGENVQITGAGSNMKVTWSTDFDTDRVSPNDQLQFVFIDKLTNRVMTMTDSTKRSVGEVQMEHPDALVGRAVHVYMAFVNNSNGETSRFNYLGEKTL